ncbi:hypothetical protein PE066_20380 [Ramlibacter tataouinensis]|uniref:hypothetical protein n=1 Tax=Ramlibacter tataouinensis TaxID=94132 RepID=UPI0022F3D61A|nr:hypothetical protein [Ramlibacter tataouinensis]WBY01777.1 hypothetical protein PE066_20380 [Ramlibacter tataouinensis]
MNKPQGAPARRVLLVAALLAVAGCAAPPPTDWNRVSLRDRHQYMPTLTGEDRQPLAVVTAGPNGLLLGTGSAAAPAVALMVQDGQARLVSQETLARMRDAGQPGSAMGASPSAAPTPGSR